MSIAIFLTVVAVSMLLNMFLNRNLKRYLRIFIPKKALIIFFIFFIIACVHISFLNNKHEKIYSIDETIIVHGVIEKVEEREYSNKYVVCVKKINNKKCSGIRFLMYTKSILKYGDYIEVLAKYEQPKDSRNFKGFSNKNYLKQNKVYGTIKPIENINVIQNNRCNLVYKTANEVRNIIVKKVNRNLSKEASDVFLGILLGEKSKISDEVSTYFKDSNMAHILAVSGAHVSYIIITISILLNKTGKRFKEIITILILMFFIVLADFTPSVERACIMAILAIIGKLICRRSDILNNLAISAIIILINNPYSIFNIGFQLSFLGVFGIVLLNEKLNKVMAKKMLKKEHKEINLYVIKYKLKKYILNIIIISICVQLLIAPIILINFNMLSLNFFVSGILVTPIFASIMIVGIISLITGFVGVHLFCLVEILVNLLVSISKFISNISFLKFTLKTPNIIWVISYYIIFILIVYVRQNSVLQRIKCKQKVNKAMKKLIILLLIICIFIQGFQDFRASKLTVYFIDVGQGDSTLVVTPNRKTILIDGGGATNYDVGKNILVPYLLDRRINKIDYLMVSHFDNDHCGGLIHVLETLKVNNVLISKQVNTSKEYEDFINIANRKNINVITLRQGDVINIDEDVKIQILYPSTNLKFDDLNNNAILAKLKYKNFSMLFTGDIEKKAEEEILKMYSNRDLKSTVLKVAHHGSKTSSTVEFLNAVRPKVALIGVRRK